MGVLRLEEYEIPIEGARAVVVGRSDRRQAGHDAALARERDRHDLPRSRTRDLARHTLDADILVAAVGVAGVISPDMVKHGAAVIDVGINRTEAGIVGDVDQGGRVAAYLTPVPEGWV